MPYLAGGIAVVAVLVAVIFGGVFDTEFTFNEASGLCRAGGAAPAAAADDIPPTYLALYQQSGAEYGVPWPVLAAIGKLESDHGRGHDAGIHQGANPWGAMGPMQFLAGTWAEYGVDGNGDGRKDVYDPTDAIPAAARMLKADGAATNLRAAIFAYNHADWYVTKVLAQAAAYTGGQDPAALTEAADICAIGALAPNQAAAAVIAFAQAQLGKPYLWGAAGPNAYDCSGLTMAAYQRVGVNLPHNAADQWNTLPHVPAAQAQPGDLVFFVTDGTVTAPGHVGIYVGGGQMIEAPNHAAPVRVSSVNTRSDLVGYARPSVRTGISGGL